MVFTTQYDSTALLSGKKTSHIAVTVRTTTALSPMNKDISSGLLAAQIKWTKLVKHTIYLRIYSSQHNFSSVYALLCVVPSLPQSFEPFLPRWQGLRSLFSCVPLVAKEIPW